MHKRLHRGAVPHIAREPTSTVNTAIHHYGRECHITIHNVPACLAREAAAMLTLIIAEGGREGGREGGSWPSCFERSVPLPSLHHHRRPSVARSTLSASALAKGARAPWSGRLVHGFIHSIALTSSFHFRKWPRARACLRASVRRRRHQWSSLFWFFFLFALGGKSGRSWRKFGGGRARSARCFTFPSRDPRVSEEGQLREMFRRQVSAKT